MPKRARPELHKIEEKEGQADLTLTADAGRRGEDTEVEGDRKKRQGRQTKMKRRRRKRNMRMKTPARLAAISDLIDDTVVGLVALVAVVIVSIPIDHSSPENKRGGEKGAMKLWHPPSLLAAQLGSIVPLRPLPPLSLPLLAIISSHVGVLCGRPQ